VGLGQGGIRTWPLRLLRLLARGAAVVLRIDAFVGLHAGVCAVWAVVGAELGWRLAWVSAAAVLASRLSGGCSGRRAGVASGAVLHPRVA